MQWDKIEKIMVPTKKISIVGRGTAGCIAYLNLLKQPQDIEIDWYYDSEIPTSSVGEGTTPLFPNLLAELGHAEASKIHRGAEFIDISSGDNYHILDARPKIGIEYINWGEKDYVHPFGTGVHGVHFDATKFQKHVFNNLTDRPKVNLINKNIDVNNIDSWATINAAGYPKEINDDYRVPKFICVNAAHVTQCDWPDEPKWLHTKTIARPWGWVFVIPLMSRCSVGYLYNRDIATLDMVKADVENVIDELGVIPNGVTNSFHFENYVRNKLVDDNVIHVGNAGFFLEPMEATTLDGVIRTLDFLNHGIQHGGTNGEEANTLLHKFFREIEYFIMMHYAAGSKWNNEFWDYAKERGRKALEEAQMDIDFYPLYMEGVYRSHTILQYFNQYSYKSNLDGLGIKGIGYSDEFMGKYSRETETHC